MKALMVIAAITCWPAVAAADGPFGVTFGDPIARYPSCKLTKSVGYYMCGSVPRPHVDAVNYVISATGKTGVCGVQANIVLAKLTDPPATADAAFASLIRQVSSVYGKGRAKEGVYEWDSEPNATFKDRVANIVVARAGNSALGPMAGATFTGDNAIECVNAIDLEGRALTPSEQDKAKAF